MAVKKLERELEIYRLVGEIWDKNNIGLSSVEVTNKIKAIDSLRKKDSKKTHRFLKDAMDLKLIMKYEDKYKLLKPELLDVYSAINKLHETIHNNQKFYDFETYSYETTQITTIGFPVNAKLTEKENSISAEINLSLIDAYTKLVELNKSVRQRLDKGSSSIAVLLIPSAYYFDKVIKENEEILEIKPKYKFETELKNKI